MMKRGYFWAVAVACGAMFLSLVAATCGDTTTRIETAGGQQQSGITVTGEGKATAPPDVALITLGVSTLADTVAEARSRAATALDAMIKSMKANAVADKDIQTQQLNIQPEYDYRDGKQLLKGFRVSNVVSAKVRDIDKTGKVVDDAVAAGGNEVQIQGLAFSIDKPDDLQRQAREAAVKDARAKAETIAAAGGVDLGDPTMMSEVSGVTPIYDARKSAAEAGGAVPETPIQPGTLDVVIDVTVTWSIK
jgi:hypothetical protein